MNHTSDQHPWFLESKYSRDNPKRDWYIWRDGKKRHGKAPPNKWRAMSTGIGMELRSSNRSMVLASISSVSTRFELLESRSQTGHV